MGELLEGIVKAHSRILPYIKRTPILTSRTVDEMLGCKVYFKCENFQKMGAFKYRGACNALLQLSEEQKQRGVITHSSGNHAQALALAAKQMGIHAVIVMPENAPLVKRNATEGYGGEVILCEATQKAREETCASLIEKRGLTMIHPYDNDNIIRGAGTAVKELLDEVGDLDVVITPVGGGGLLSGSSAYSKLSGKVGQVYGAEPTGADDAYRSLKEGKPLPQTDPRTIADGLRTSLSQRTFEIISEYVDGIIPVTDDEIIEAMKILFERMKIVVEPSGATPLASLMKAREEGTVTEGSSVGLVLSGGNVDLSAFFESYR